MSKSFDDRSASIHCDLSRSALVEKAIQRQEGVLAASGALVVSTGARTRPSPQDRFIVYEPSTAEEIDWGGAHQEFDAGRFDELWERVEDYVSEEPRFVSYLHVGAHVAYYLPVRLTTQSAWQNLFGSNLFIRPSEYNPKGKEEWQILSAEGFVCDPERDGTRSEACVILNFAKRKVLLAGMAYAEEIKKAMFTVQSFLLPEKDVLPMHCAAAANEAGETSLFFGLSGTGKTTLSIDPAHFLVGDDEHGWARGGVFNLEGGCYAKTANLNPDEEPEVWQAIRFGAVVENIVLDGERRADFDDTSLTDNGRCAFPLAFVTRRVEEEQVAEPTAILFLTCDPLGVLPPVAILSKEAAAYHFLSGYGVLRHADKADRSGQGIGDVTGFSPCFGERFFPRHPWEYAELLMKRIEEFGSQVYLVNTGWRGNPRQGGERFSIGVSRAIVQAVLSGALRDQATTRMQPFNLAVPQVVPGLSAELLDPASAWEDAEAFREQAASLAQRFVDNFRRFEVPEEIVLAGPVR